MPRAREPSKADFRVRRSIENSHARKLRKISREVGRILSNARTRRDLEQAEKLLRNYAELITPWAWTESGNLINTVAFTNERQWSSLMRSMGRNLRKEVSSGYLASAIQRLREEYAREIKSIPLDAAERLRNLSRESVYTGLRPEEIARRETAELMVAKRKEFKGLSEEQIAARMKEEERISLNRATLIARTESSTATTLLTQARAEYIGSTKYIWRTSQDSRVRASHQEMDGEVCEWANPPLLSDGTRTHPGAIYNCRCWPEVII